MLVPRSDLATPTTSQGAPFEPPVVAMEPFELAPQRSPPCPKSRRRSVRYMPVSRKTPDRLFARIAAHKPSTTVRRVVEAWALKIFHGRASTMSIHEPKRKELIALLESAAERAEAAAAARTEEVKMATPAAGAPVARQETQVLKEPARSGLGGEEPVWLVGSPYVPLCAI